MGFLIVLRIKSRQPTALGLNVYENWHIHDNYKAKSRQYRGMFEVHITLKNNGKFGKKISLNT